MTRCFSTPVPVNGFVHIYFNTVTVRMKDSDMVQSIRTSLGCCKLVQPQRFSVVLINVSATAVNVTQANLCRIKALRSSQTIKRKRLGIIRHKSSFTPPM
jgi:hypothetical protein